MTTYADLEIGLHRRSTSNYGIDLRFTTPGSDDDKRVGADVAVAQFDFERLRQSALDNVEYGKALAGNLFVDPAIREAFTQTRHAAEVASATLRVRLFIGPSAPELHALRWEMLCDPESNQPLFLGERLIFSRYLSSIDWRPARRHPKGTLRAVAAIANPSDVTEYCLDGRPLTPIDVEGELNRARTALSGMAVAELASGGNATPNKLFDSLRDGCDVLYLVCHGAAVEGETWLWMENPAGGTERLSGTDFVGRIRELQQPPTMIVLASCQTAGIGEGAHTADNGALALLGPSLAKAGVPAVLAMQGNVTMRTLETFLPKFFQELQDDGQLDRAAAVARGAVRKRPDWWIPVLFMRLRSGCIWYSPGISAGEPMKKWKAVILNIRSQACTPILGPGLTESILGSRRSLAQRLAEQSHFPMSPHSREDLTQVAQYLAIKEQQSVFPQQQLILHLRTHLLGLAGSGGTLPQELMDQLASEEARGDISPVAVEHLCELASAIGEQRRAADPKSPFRVLAALPLPVYVTTTFDDLLTDALAAEGKRPHVELFRWKRGLQDLPSTYDREPNFVPSPDQPLVYYLFGHLRHPDALVLTEDDYFDFLRGSAANSELIPPVVRKRFADSGLLFVGYQLDDWDFRVLYRSIINQEGSHRRDKYAHVAAQIEPEEGRLLEPEGARKYLEKYFEGANVSIYWGSPDNFARDLLSHLKDGAA